MGDYAFEAERLQNKFYNDIREPLVITSYGLRKWQEDEQKGMLGVDWKKAIGWHVVETKNLEAFLTSHGRNIVAGPKYNHEGRGQGLTAVSRIGYLCNYRDNTRIIWFKNDADYGEPHHPWTLSIEIDTEEGWKHYS